MKTAEEINEAINELVFKSYQVGRAYGFNIDHSPEKLAEIAGHDKQISKMAEAIQADVVALEQAPAPRIGGQPAEEAASTQDAPTEVGGDDDPPRRCGAGGG